jgi:hypothetical protein
MIKFASKVFLLSIEFLLMKTPDIRKKDIDFKANSLNWPDAPALKRFKMSVEPQMASVPARVLKAPELLGGLDMAGGANFAPSSGKWDLRGYRLKSVPLIPSN